MRINSYDGQCCGGVSIPAYLKQAYSDITVACTAKAEIPRYWHPAYQRAFSDLIHAFGARYDGDPRIAWIEISNGIFGETSPVESIYNDCLQTVGLTSDMWVDFVKWSVDTYRHAFPRTQLLLQYAPRYLERWERREFSDYAASLGVGLKHNGLKPDGAGTPSSPTPTLILSSRPIRSSGQVGRSCRHRLRGHRRPHQPGCPHQYVVGHPQRAR